MAHVLDAQLHAKLVRAEGVVGIARAFLRAGARFVIASLWQIDDEATLEREHWKISQLCWEVKEH